MNNWIKKNLINQIKISFITLFGVILTFCNNKPDLKRIEYMNFQCTHADSIWQFAKEYKSVNEFSETIINGINRLKSNPSLQDSTNKLIQKLENHLNLNPDPEFLSYYYVMKCRHAIEEKDHLSTKKWHQKWQSFEPFANTNNIISHELDMGISYYQQNKFDSSIISFNKALDVSENSNDTFYRGILLLNLGATYYKVNMYKSASECFSKALVFKESKTPNPLNPNEQNELIMLNNNLMVSLSQESRFEDVFNLYNKYKYLLNKPKIQEEHKRLFKLNYITSLINTKQYSEIPSILSSIPIIKEDEENYSYYVKVKTNYWIETGKLDSFKSAYSRILPFIYQNQPNSIDLHLYNLVKGVQLGLLNLNYDSLYRQFSLIQPQLYNLSSLSHYCQLFSEIETYNKNYNKSLEWKNKELEYELDFSKQTSGIRLSNITEQINQARLTKKLDDQEYLIKTSEIRHNWLTTTIIIAIALLFALILIFILILKSRKKQIDILALESKLKNRELELLKVQNEKQANTVQTTNIAIQKISELSEIIRQSDLAKNPTMIELRMNLDRLTELVYEEREEKMDQDVLEKYFHLKTKYPQLSDLNETSFKVFVLSILDNQPKDIANLLNLNMQYVRNIRSKIKKDLQPDLGNDWNWTDLKNH